MEQDQMEAAMDVEMHRGPVRRDGSVGGKTFQVMNPGAALIHRHSAGLQSPAEVTSQLWVKPGR
jgi:hypothetical protein